MDVVQVQEIKSTFFLLGKPTSVWWVPALPLACSYSCPPLASGVPLGGIQPHRLAQSWRQVKFSGLEDHVWQWWCWQWQCLWMKTTQICAILQPGKLESRSAMIIISWQGYFVTSMEASTYIKSTNFVTSISLRSCWPSWPLMVYFRRWSTAEDHVVFKRKMCNADISRVLLYWSRSGGESVGVFFRLLGPCLPISIIIICYLLIIRRLRVVIIICDALFKSNQINAGFSQEDNQNWMWTNFLGATVNKGFKVFRRFGFAFLSQSIIYLEISRDWKDILCRSLLHLYHNDAKEE